VFVEIHDISSVCALPLWKYGARAAKPRRIGPLNFADVGEFAGDHRASRVCGLNAGLAPSFGQI